MSNFKKGGRKIFRKRAASPSDSDDDNDDINLVLSETKELQKLRERQNGVSVVELASGKKRSKDDDDGSIDPLKLKSGGMTRMQEVRKSDLKKIDGVTTFAVETNRGDKDADMMKYVEEQVIATKGVSAVEEKETSSKKQNYDILFEVPEHLRVGSRKTNEDMTSNQMLQGIPEVDLGIETKIRNIQETEEAKTKLARESMKRKDEVSKFVPTNMAVDYVQHTRWTNTGNDRVSHYFNTNNRKKETAAAISEKEKLLQDDEAAKKPRVKIVSYRDLNATDDLHYDKFRKFIRR